MECEIMKTLNCIVNRYNFQEMCNASIKIKEKVLSRRCLIIFVLKNFSTIFAFNRL